MEEGSFKPPVTQSTLIILALGLLVGFVIAFVFVLSRLPVDGIISQYNKGEVEEAEMSKMNFDYYSVLQENPQIINGEPPVTFTEPPVTIQPLPAEAPLPQIKVPEIVQVPPVPVQPVPVQPVPVQPAPVQPKIVEPVQPPVEAREPVTAPVQPEVQPRSQQSAPVREMLANSSGQDLYFVEAASFAENEQAVRARDSLQDAGIDAFVVERPNNSGTFEHSVRVGPFIDQARLDDVRDRLRSRGLKTRMIKVKG